MDIVEQQRFRKLLQYGIKTVASKKEKQVVEVRNDAAEFVGVEVGTLEKWMYDNSIKRIADEHVLRVLIYLLANSDALSVDWLIEILRATSAGLFIPSEPTRSWLVGLFNTASRDEALLLQTVDRLIPAVGNNADAVIHSLDLLNFVGRSKEIREVRDHLRATPSAVLLSGLGGVGKTALALEICRLITSSTDGDFAKSVFISAKQEIVDIGGTIRLGAVRLTLDSIIQEIAREVGRDDLLPMNETKRQAGLKSYLKAIPTLIILDNMEVVDKADELIQRIDTELLAGTKSAMLITSRNRINYSRLVTVALRGLDRFEDSRQLLMDYAHKRVALPLLEATEGEVKHLHEITEGHPLALKLIVGQMDDRDDLTQVIEELQRARVNESFEHFFRFLYEAIWIRLSADARRVLVKMAILPANTGVEKAFIQELSRLTKEALDRALIQLLHFNLTERLFRGHDPWYALHSMTQYFVLGDIVGELNNDIG